MRFLCRGGGKIAPNFSNLGEGVFTALRFGHFFAKFSIGTNISWEGKMIFFGRWGSPPPHLSTRCKSL